MNVYRVSTAQVERMYGDGIPKEVKWERIKDGRGMLEALFIIMSW